MKLTKATFGAVAIAAALSLVGFAPATNAAPSNNASPTAQYVAAGTGQGSHIVVLKSSANVTSQIAKATGKGIKVFDRFSKVLKGFAADLTAAQLAALKADPAVKYIERNPIVSINATDYEGTQAVGDLWGLDRIDATAAVNLDAPGTSGADQQYHFDTTAPDVTAYVIDTGILSTHVDLAGRVRSGTSTVKGPYSTEDCEGHGTHVAGTIGGTNYGVAKQVKLVAVRVLNCRGTGTGAGVIAGMDWTIADKAANNITMAVANMSLGGGFSQAENDAAAAMVNAGIVLVVAAGNESSDAATHSPASAPEAITVAAASFRDKLASFSNYGSLIDIAAPGSAILSSVIGSNTATDVYSGTSMASPHVAGAAALLLQGGTAPSAVDATLKANAQANVILPNAAAVAAGFTNNLPMLQTKATSSAAITDPGIVAPSQPTGLTATAGRKGKVTLTWTANGAAANTYWLYEITSPGVYGIYAIPAGSTTFTASTGLPAGSTVTYKIVAFNRAGASPMSAETSPVTTR